MVSRHPHIQNLIICSDPSLEVVLLHLHSTELAINQIVLYRTPIMTNDPGSEHLDCLYTCIDNIKAWFDVFFSIPPISYIGFPFSIFSQLMRCLVILYRLSTLDDPAWDKRGARKTADPLPILDQVISKIEQVTTAAGLDNTGSVEGDVFVRSARMLRNMRPRWEEKLGPEPDMTSALPISQNINDMTLLEPFQLDFVDNEWLTDFMLAPNS